MAHPAGMSLGWALWGQREAALGKLVLEKLGKGTAAAGSGASQQQILCQGLVFYQPQQEVRTPPADLLPQAPETSQVFPPPRGWSDFPFPIGSLCLFFLLLPANRANLFLS